MGHDGSDHFGVRQFKFELGHQVVNGLTARLAMSQPTIVQQPLPMLNGIPVHPAASPTAGACNSGDQVGANGAFNSHSLFSRATFPMVSARVRPELPLSHCRSPQLQEDLVFPRPRRAH